MKKRYFLIALVIFFISFGVVPLAFSGEIDILLNKLVEKGVLSRQDANEVLSETRVEVQRQKEMGSIDSSKVPSWVQKVKLKGDVRIRHQYEKRNETSEARNRGRVRYRLGLEAKVNDETKIGAGIASGSSDPRSTNQTFQNTFDSPDIRLDYAYAEYKPVEWAKFIGGKFKKKGYLWHATDLMWDGDINPEGGAIHLSHKMIENMEGFLNTGVFVLDENGTSDDPDPFMHYVQGGVKWHEGLYDAKLAGIYYGFNQLENTDPDNSSDTNTRGGGNSLAFDYDSVGVSAEFGISDPFDLPIERLAVFGDYIQNISEGVNDDDTGWALGVKVGDKKVKDWGNWQGKYIYANLGKDAFPDFLPDSDRYSGSTDVRSHEAVLQYGLNKNVVFEIDYYRSRRIKADKNPESVVQNSLMFKF